MTDYDVVVVGARVAGASTAMLLARRGFRVLLIDRAGPPRDTLSTHALLRPGVLQLTKWGVLSAIVEKGTPPIEYVMLGFGPKVIPIHFDTRFGVTELYAPRRTVLDTVLLESAMSAGAEASLGSTVTGVTHESERVTGVIVRSSGEEQQIRSRFVVGADGTRSRVAQAVNATTSKSHGPLNRIIYAYFSDLPTKGYEWQFTVGTSAGFMPTNDGQVNVWAGSPSGAAGGEMEDRFWSTLAAASPVLRERVGAATQESPFKSTPGIRGFLRKPFGPGWALVGDAGSTLDPISAHGMSSALRDAGLCAASLTKALKDPEREDEALAEFEALRDSVALPLYEESAALAAYRWDEEEASSRLRRISRIGDEECELVESLDFV